MMAVQRGHSERDWIPVTYRQGPGWGVWRMCVLSRAPA